MLNVIRDLFINLDAIVYSLIEQIFQLIINLASFDLFSAKVLNEFSKRVYLILGLVMVFKLIIAFIKILIDPDKMSDKENGVGNLLKRVAISMLLIVLVPTIFSEAKKLQTYVLPVIPKVILAVPADVGSENVNEEATTTTGNEQNGDNIMISTGRLMAYYSFLPFFYYSDEECNNGHLIGTSDDDSKATIYSVADAVPEVNLKECSQAKNGYTYNYRMFISTVVGAYLIYVLVTIALKVAIRTIKFGLCQLIAPIPIASYIDPGTSKKAFDNWVSTSIKVYLDLFIRIIIVYFVIYVFSVLFDGGRAQNLFDTYGTFQGLLILLFIIIGLLNFAKEMPKFITGMLGVSDGFSDIADMFNGQGFRDIRSAGQVITNPLAVGASNAINNWRQNRLDENGKRRGVADRLRLAAGSAVAGGTSAFARSNMAVLRGRDVAEAARMGREGAITARRNRATDRQTGANAWNRTGVRVRDYLGIDSSVTFGDQEIQAADAIEKNIGNLKSTLTTLYRKKGADINVSMDNDANNAKIRKNVNDIMSLATDPMFSSYRTKFNNKRLTYDDLLQMRELAQNAAQNGNVSAAALATALSDSDDRMRGIQKAMFTASNRGSLLNANGQLKTDLNFDSQHPENMDSDLREVYGQMRQTYNSNSATLNLNPNEFNNEIHAMFEKGSGLDDRVKERRAQARDTIGDRQRQEAAARESLQRRQQNSQQNSGK